MVVFIAGVGLVEALQGAVDCLPGGLLLVSVLHLGNGLTTRQRILLCQSRDDCCLLFVEECNVRKLLPPCSVDRVSEARMVRVQLRSIGQDLVGKLIKILDLSREPRHSLLVVLVLGADHLEVA